MSKADTLLKKASFFERLALYSDRKSYLQALAQETPAPALDKNTRNLLLEAQQIMQNAGLDASAIGNVTLFNKLDQWGAAAKSIRDALMLGKLSPLSDEYKRLQTISTQLKAPASPPTEAEQAMAGPADVTFKPDRISAFPPINKEDQKAVARFVMTEGLTFVDPNKMGDGQLGPETRKALEAIKDYFAKANPQNPRMSDQQAIQAAKFNK
jgi:hypothetical protein